MKRNKFNLSRDRIFSSDLGYLVPTMVMPVMPGDKVKYDNETFQRTAPLVAPIMSKVNTYKYAFWVPERIIWKDSEEFRTRGRNNDSTVTVPRIKITDSRKATFAKGQLPDYMGIPPIPSNITVGGSHYVNALPFRAYQHIVNEYFRNQEIETDFEEETWWKNDSADYDSDSDISALTQLRMRNWEKDYFNNAKLRPAEVNSINTFAPVQSIDTAGLEIYKEISKYLNDDGTNPNTGQVRATSTGNMQDESYQNSRVENLLDPLGVDIRDIKKVSALHEWMLRLMRSGYRLKDYLKSMWGVNISDSLVQRAEYLGGEVQPFRVSEVLQTAEGNDGPVGQMAGHALSYGNDISFNREFKEHGFIIILQCVIPKPVYQKNLESFWLKFDHMDYANPVMADLGRQEIKKGELQYVWTNTQAQNEDVFGYIDRFADDKSAVSSVAGDFRDTLSYWTFMRYLSGSPGLDETFIKCQPGKNPFSVTANHVIYSLVQHNISVIRALPYFPSITLTNG